MRVGRYFGGERALEGSGRGLSPPSRARGDGSAVCRWASFASALLETVAVAVHLEYVDVMGEAVEQGAGEPLGAEDLGPFVKGQIAGDQDGCAFVSLAKDFEQEFSALAAERLPLSSEKKYAASGLRSFKIFSIVVPSVPFLAAAFPASTGMETRSNIRILQSPPSGET
jgi:hypothetical protein